MRFLSEKIFSRVAAWGRKRAYTEHLSCTFGIRPRNDRAVPVDKTFFVEVVVDGKWKCMAYSEHRAKGVRARAQMRDFTQEF